MRFTVSKLVGGFTGALILSVISQNVAWSSQTKAAPATPVTQDQLNAASSDVNSFLHTNGTTSKPDISLASRSTPRM
jgi:hypothetical protein